MKQGISTLRMGALLAAAAAGLAGNSAVMLPSIERGAAYPYGTLSYVRRGSKPKDANSGRNRNAAGRTLVATAKRASIKRKNVRRHKQHVTRATRRSGR